jgi:hypothetical protein
MKIRVITLLAVIAALLAGLLIAQVQSDGSFPVDSNRQAGAARVDITPKEVKDYDVIGHPRKVTGVREMEFDSPFDLGICMGASHAYSMGEPAYPETLKGLEAMLRPRG